MAPMRSDTRKLLRTGLWILGTGVAAVLEAVEVDPAKGAVEFA